MLSRSSTEADERAVPAAAAAPSRSHQVRMRPNRLNRLFLRKITGSPLPSVLAGVLHLAAAPGQVDAIPRGLGVVARGQPQEQVDEQRRLARHGLIRGLLGGQAGGGRQQQIRYPNQVLGFLRVGKTCDNAQLPQITPRIGPTSTAILLRSITREVRNRNRSCRSCRR